MILDAKEKRIIPAFCCFGIVDDCMFRCKMCFKWQEDQAVAEKKEVPFDSWRKAIDGLKKIVPDPNSFVINFGGGEALMREDLLFLVKYAHEQGFITNIATNGWLIDPSMADRIAQSGLSSINISLDSLSDRIHDDLRGKLGAAEQAKQAVRNLRRYSKDIEIGICTVIYDANVDEVWPLTKWVQHNNDINWIVFMAAMQPNNTSNGKKWYEGEYSYLWPRNQKKVRRLINKLMWKKWWGWKIQNPYHQLRAFKKYYAQPDRFVKSSACNMDRAVHISAQGDIFLCFNHGRLGTIADEQLEKAWYSQKADEEREKIAGCKENCHFLLNCFFEREYPFALKGESKKVKG